MTQTNSQRVYADAAKAGKVSPGFLNLKEKKGESYVSNGVHIVKFLSDKVVDIKTKKGEVKGGMEYMFSENGLRSKYQVFAKDRNGELYYFIQRMAGFKIGDMVSLEWIKKEGADYGFVDVKRPTGSTAKVPVIEQNDDGDQLKTEEEEAKEEHIPEIEKGKDDINLADIPF